MFRVTIDIFSGRPNPSWIVEGPPARDFLQRISRTRSAIVSAKIAPPPAALGHRSTIIEVLDRRQRRKGAMPERFLLSSGSSRDEDKSLELTQELLASAPDALSLDRRSLMEAIATTTTSRRMDKRPHDVSPLSLAPPTSCTFETIPYNPKYWNAPDHVLDNNCYAYATNRRTDTFPQPGRASGREAASMDCASVSRAAQHDGARLDCPPLKEKPRLLVALVIWPGIDYHWYRFHSDGFWSHKPGSTPAVKLDNSGHVIHDPRTADRGPYSDFCSFFLVPRSIRVA